MLELSYKLDLITIWANFYVNRDDNDDQIRLPKRCTSDFEQCSNRLKLICFTVNWAITDHI